MRPLLVNRHRRAVRCPAFLGARVQGGSIGSSRQAGVGDCALLDFSQGLFAVADSSDRNPSASRDFMVMFSRMMEEKGILSARRVYGTAEASALKERLIDESGKLLASMPFRNGCTFTGVIILQTTDGLAGIVMHTGDSLLIQCDLDGPAACQHTNNNFWMVGRSRHFFQIDDLPISRATRLLLATDGIGGVPVPPGRDREEFILSLFETCSPDEMPDRLLGEDHTRPDGWDDMAIVAIDPSVRTFSSGRILIGGTSRLEEGIYQEEKSQGLFADRYTPISLPDGDQRNERILLS